MSQILTFCLGNTGTGIGKQFWEQVASDHGVLPDGSLKEGTKSEIEKIEACFESAQNGKYIPRGLFIDWEPNYQTKISSWDWGKLFVGGQILTAQEQKYFQPFEKSPISEDKIFLENFSNSLRNQIERCNFLEAIQIIYDCSGEFGSQFSSTYLEDTEIFTELLNIKHKKIKIIGMPEKDTVVTGSNGFDNRRRWANAIDDVAKMIKSGQTNLIIPFFKSSVAAHCINEENISNPTFDDINAVLGRTLANLTSGTRMPCSRYVGYKKIYQEIAIFPSLNWGSIKDISLPVNGNPELTLQEQCSVFNRIINPYGSFSHNLYDKNQVEMERNSQALGTVINYRGAHLGQTLTQLGHQSSLRLKKMSKTFSPGGCMVMSGFVDVPQIGYKMNATKIDGDTKAVFNLKYIINSFRELPDTKEYYAPLQGEQTNVEILEDRINEIEYYAGTDLNVPEVGPEEEEY